MKKVIKSKFSFLLLLLLTLIVLYFSLKDDFDNVINVLRNANVLWLVIATLLTILYYVLSSIGLHRIIRKYNSNFSLWQTIKLKFKTKFFDAVTPTSTGGQPYQIYSLTSSGISVLDSTNICLQNFVAFQVALVLIGLISVGANYFLHLFPENHFLKLLVLVGFLINTGIAAFLFLVSFTKKINKFIYRKVINIALKLHIVKDAEKTNKMYNEYVENVKRGTTSLMKNKKEFILIIVLNFVGLCLNYLVPLAILYSTGDYSSFGPFECIVASAYVLLMGAFIPLPGGTGGLEFGFISFFGNFLKGSKLTALMLMWRFVTYYLVMILGAISLNIRKKEDSI